MNSLRVIGLLPLDKGGKVYTNLPTPFYVQLKGGLHKKWQH